MKSVKHKIRLLIANRQKLLADGCKSLLEPKYSVVDVVTDGQALRAALATSSPDILILDADLPALSALEFIERLSKRQPHIRCMLLSTEYSANFAAEAFKRGAFAYILKQNSGFELLLAVKRVGRGKSYLSTLLERDKVKQLVIRKHEDKKRLDLTPRQGEILGLLVQGNSMVSIGLILGLNKGTVAFHKYRIMTRLGVTSYAALLEYAMSQRPHVGP